MKNYLCTILVCIVNEKMANQLETMQSFDSVMVGPSSNRIWIVASSLFLSISTSPPSGSVDFGCDCAKKTNKQTKNDSESPAEPLSRTQFAATSDRDLADELLSLFSKCSVENYVGGATFRCFFFLRHRNRRNSSHASPTRSALSFFYCCCLYFFLFFLFYWLSLSWHRPFKYGRCGCWYFLLLLVLKLSRFFRIVFEVADFSNASE